MSWLDLGVKMFRATPLFLQTVALELAFLLFLLTYAYFNYIAPHIEKGALLSQITSVAQSLQAPLFLFIGPADWPEFQTSLQSQLMQIQQGSSTTSQNQAIQAQNQEVEQDLWTLVHKCWWGCVGLFLGAVLFEAVLVYEGTLSNYASMRELLMKVLETCLSIVASLLGVGAAYGLFLNTIVLHYRGLDRNACLRKALATLDTWCQTSSLDLPPLTSTLHDL
jgi:hypothetical protein